MSIHFAVRSRLASLACVMVTISGVSSLNAERQPIVVLDGYYNNELKLPGHYRWEARDNGGFSSFAAMLQGLGAELRTISEPVTKPSLSQVDCFILVDPDTPAESPRPNYIQDREIHTLTKWVKGGGWLVLLGNDRGNAEFLHLNRLAKRFGVQFVEQTLGAEQGPSASKLTLRAAPPFFHGELWFYAVDVAPLKVTAKRAEILLAHNRTPVMVLVPYGRGLVLALGDPWLYNEYIHTKDNEEIGRQVFERLLRRRR